MLQHRAARLPEDAQPAQDEPAPVCRITEGATPVVTSPTDESMQYLYDQLGLAHANVVDRHDVSDGLHRLGESLCCREAELHRRLDACFRMDCTENLTHDGSD